MNANVKTVGISISCLILGYVIGSVQLFQGGAGKPRVAVGGEVADTREETVSHTKTVERPFGTVAASPDSEPEVDRGTAEWAAGGEKMVWVPLSFLEQLSTVGGSRNLGRNLFGGDGEIEEALKINDREKAAIQTAWQQTQRELRDLEVRTMVSEVSADGSVVTITVPDLSSGVGKIGEGLGSEIRNVLGESRSDVFQAVKQVGGMFSAVAGERTYKIEAEPTGDGGWRYHMTLEGPDNRRVWVSDTIPDEIRHLTDVVKIPRTLSEE